VYSNAVPTQDMTNPISLLLTFISLLTLLNTSSFHKIGSTDLLHRSPASDFMTSKVCLICFPKSLRFNTI